MFMSPYTGPKPEVSIRVEIRVRTCCGWAAGRSVTVFYPLFAACLRNSTGARRARLERGRNVNTVKWIAALLAACACASHAAEVSIPRTEPVVVIATRFEQPSSESGVTVIDRAAIERSTARSVIELLSLQAGIQSRDSTGSPDLQIDMRGFGQTGDLNTAVLIDGQRFNEIDTGPVKWSSIPLSAVERIEILRGSGAVLYGGGATGGVINIVTRRPRAGEKQAEAHVGLGSYRTTDLHGGLTVAGERIGLRLHVTDRRSDNYRENNRIEQRNVLLDMRTLGAGSHAYVKLATDDQDLRNPGQLTLAELAVNRRGTSTPNDFSAREGVRADVGGVLFAGPFELAANLAYRKQDTRAHFAAFGADVNNGTDGIAFAPRAKLPYTLGGLAQSLVAGLDYEEGRLDRDVTGSFFSGRSKARQDKRAIYLQHHAAFGGGWFATIGARAQHAENALDDPATAPMPIRKRYSLTASELAVRYEVIPALAFTGKTGRSFRLPSVEETNFSSPALLEPQTSRDREVGLEYRTPAARVRLAAYRIDLENEIAFNPVLFDNVNLSPTRREGAELETRWRATQDLEMFVNYAHVLARFRSGIYGGANLAGNAVPLVPRNTVSTGLSWRVRDKTRLSATVRLVGAQRLANDETNMLAQDIPAYTTADVKVAHESGAWMFDAAVLNLFDRSYYTQGGVNALGLIRVFPAPKRSIHATVRRTF